ncbi:DUF6968 family protein [Devosia sp. Root635]|uniref:DUF6968 family protein n=1 Tax=Devosia sp. Root635 TaxID=1736575 RepID=UPI0006F79C39|nr:hypothetical protein [Devosia sp. Root635]KRA40180.1 hypothetical protein ASD80_12245 [Devosia sp. Root635]
MIVAQRILMLRLQTTEVTVPISLHAPVEGDRCWECTFAIGWPEGERTTIVRGFDGVQALYLAMQRIAVELYGSAHHAAGKLSWGEPGNGFGFPMAKAGYQDLVGEDRIAQVPD